MTRETIDEKAHRLLTDGSVRVWQVLGANVIAVVHGDRGDYCVTHRRGGWACSCPARGRCAHLVAVGLVVAPGSRLGIRTGGGS